MNKDAMSKNRLGKLLSSPASRKSLIAALGLLAFAILYLAPSFPEAEDANGKAFALSREGQAAIGLFLLAAIWWVFEVIPIGVTGIAIGVVQALFLIRDPRVAFTDFMDPSVWFIIGSLVIGMVFTKTGLTRRLAYKMIVLVGERTSMIYLGCFVMTAGLTLFMAHTAVAATVFPLLMAIYALYDDTGKPSRFGKGLFIGMAFVAGAGSIITLLGAARGAVAISFFQEVAGREITFFELSYYMLPVGIVMTFLLWLLIMIVFRPEKKTIPGLRQRTEQLYSRLGGITRPEVAALAIVGCAIFALGLRSVFPALDFLDKSAVILTATLLFFVFRILDQEDLERIPWNIVLLFGGAMSIGFCLKDTGAADWMAINFLGIFSEESNPFIFVVSIGFFIMLMTNLIMNVAAIAIFLPVALTMSPYLGASQEVVLFTCLVAAGMPFLFLIGAAPNAIAYESKQFTSMEFLKLGIPASAMLIGVVAVFVMFVWPLMGMPIFLD